MPNLKQVLNLLLKERLSQTINLENIDQTNYVEGIEYGCLLSSGSFQINALLVLYLHPILHRKSIFRTLNES